MARQGDRYSRAVAWLKVVFPLTALGLLSTLFLVSHTVNPESVVPFAETEIQDRLRDQQITGPFFSGATADGEQISFSAEKITTPAGRIGNNEALDVDVKLNLLDGTELTLRSDSAVYDVAQDFAELTGDVIITTSAGYRIVSDLLTSEMSKVNLRSPGQVTATGPAGTLEAGSMELTGGQGSDATQLFFTNGVKLIYTPVPNEE